MPQQVATTSETREGLTGHVKDFREDPLADPIVFGSHRRPEAVLMSSERYERMLSLIEDLEIAATVRTRLAATDERLSLDEVLVRAGRPDLI